jgi:hypothetical protein
MRTLTEVPSSSYAPFCALEHPGSDKDEVGEPTRGEVRNH